MAPESYWPGFLEHFRAGDWWPALRQLAEGLRLKLNLQSHFVVLANSDFDMGRAGVRIGEWKGVADVLGFVPDTPVFDLKARVASKGDRTYQIWR